MPKLKDPFEGMEIQTDDPFAGMEIQTKTNDPFEGMSVQFQNKDPFEGMEIQNALSQKQPKNKKQIKFDYNSEGMPLKLSPDYQRQMELISQTGQYVAALPKPNKIGFKNLDHAKDWISQAKNEKEKDRRRIWAVQNLEQEDKWEILPDIKNETAKKQLLSQGTQGLSAPFIDPVIDIPMVVATGGTALGFKQGTKAGIKALGKDIISGLTMGTSDVVPALAKGGTRVTKKAIGKWIANSRNKEQIVEKATQLNKLIDSTEKLDVFNEVVEKTVKSKELKPISYFDDLENLSEEAKQVVNRKRIGREELKQLDRTNWQQVKEQLGRTFVDDMFNARGKIEKLEKDAIKKVKETFKQAKKQNKLIDIDQLNELIEMRELASNAVQKRIAVKGSSAKVKIMVDEIDKDIFKGLSEKEINTIDEIRESLRNKELAARGIKSTGGFTAEAEQAALDALQQQKPEIYKKLAGKSEQIQEVYKRLLNRSLEEGLITKEQFDNMLAKGAHYNPREFIQYLDPATETVRHGRKVTVGESGYDYITEGSEQTLKKDSRGLLQEAIARTESRIDRNNANKALWELAQTDNDVVKVLDGSVPNNYDTINVMIDGQKQSMIMRKDLAAEWKGLDPLLSSQQAKWLSRLSGTKVLKAFATGVNPKFAFRNFARDAAYIYLSPEYSAFMPKAAAQMANNYRRTFKDALLNKGLARDYVMAGGSMETLTKQGRLFEKHLEKTQDVLGFLGNFSERWTRLAHMDRAMLNGKSKEAAAIIARDALDFGAGGTITRAADTIVPYLNAGVQGTRGLFKFAAKDPAKFSLKIAQLGGLASGLYLYNTQNYKEDYDRLDAREKATNWIIMTPFTYKDEDGEIQKYHIAIPKDQSQRIFTSIFENGIAEATGEKADLRQVRLAAQDAASLLPGGESYLSPTMKATLGYMINKDFWRGEDIWKGENVYSEEEYYKSTPTAYVKAGEVTGMSPVKLRYALQQFFTSSNTFTDGLGLGVQKIFDTMNSDEQVLTTEKLMKEIPGLGTFLRGTRYDYKLEGHEDIEKEVNSKMLNLRREQNKLFDKFVKTNNSSDQRKIEKWIDSQDILVREYLYNRYADFQIVNKGTDKRNWRWWMDVIYEDKPEAQAKKYWEKYKTLSSKEKNEYDEKMQILAEANKSINQYFYPYLEKLKKGK